MKFRTINMTLLLLLAAAATFLSGCGAPAANNGAGNQNATNTTANSNTAKTTDAKAMSATCTAADDTQIEGQIRALIDGDPALYPHRMHINYSTTICEVKLRGWIDTFVNFQNLYAKIKNAGGVRSIDISNFRILAAGAKPPEKEECTGGTVQCGELCIPPNEHCTYLPGGSGGSGGTGNVGVSPTPKPKA